MKRVVALAILVVSLSLVALISFRPESDSSPPSSERNLFLTVQEWGFNQTNGGPTITVNAGETVRLSIKNTGQLVHEVAATPVIGAELYWYVIEPDEAVTIKFVPLAQGDFFLICMIPEHLKQGMQTRVIVEG